MTVYILGGGPTGLAAAHGLMNDPSARFVLIERGASLGGLAQTMTWNGHGDHDLGPHKIFTLDKELMARVEDLLPASGWLTRPKSSRIFMRGKFLPYPPSPFSLIGIYGPVAFAGMVLDYALTRIKVLFKSNAPGTFEEDLVGRVGPKLYEALFKPIALKIWGPPSELDVKLSQGRVQTPSLLEVLGRLLKITKTSKFEALDFRYPRGGLQRLWDAIEARTRDRGSYLLRHEIASIRSEGGSITSISCVDKTSGERKEISVGKDDFVFSTLPLSKLPDLMSGAMSSGCRQEIKDVVRLNDLLLVFLKVDRPSLLQESWVFIPDPDVVFHRVSEQESFDPDMASGGSIVCCEIMSGPARPLAQESDERLADMAEAGLARMGYGGFRVLDRKVIRLPSSYPVFKPGFEPVLERALAEMDGIANFRSIGRQGAFNYIGTLDSMDIGYGAIRWLVEPNRSADSWQRERTRTSHYPVLD